jgi:hypothetical protein
LGLNDPENLSGMFGGARDPAVGAGSCVARCQ